MITTARTCFLFLLMMVTHRPNHHAGIVSAQQNMTYNSTCGDEMDTACATDESRFCYLSNDTETPTCGNCLPGFVEWRTRSCINEDQVDIALFLDEYEPVYATTVSNAVRATLLLKTIRFLAAYQNQNPPLPFKLGLNKFSADSEEDKKSLLGFTPVVVQSSSSSSGGEDVETAPPLPVTFESTTVEANRDLPSQVDWVSQGAVTSVKDQERCGCCWAVSIAGSLEGAAALQNNFLESLSFQQFISCDNRNLGCDGGSLVYAMAYPIVDTDGVAKADDYKFTDGRGQTTYECNTKVSTALAVGKASYVLDYYDDLTFNQRLQKMKAAVAEQPVSMVLRSGCDLFSNYNSGIMTTDNGCECIEPTCADHAVLMVGYDDTSDPPYWKLKNSWGTGWGEDGYFRIAQTQKGNYGLFGILTHGVVPDLTYQMTNGTVDDSDPLFPPEQPEEDPLPWWAWLLVTLAAISVIFCVVSCTARFLCPSNKFESQAQ